MKHLRLPARSSIWGLYRLALDVAGTARVVPVLCHHICKVLTEEKRLRRDFGKEYESYSRRTGRFLPFTFKK